MMKKILIVEDDEVMRRMLTDAFKVAGFKVGEAPNGQEGLKMAFEFRPDAILADLMMPLMDGLTMLSKIREDEMLKDIPVTILTNSGDSDMIATALDKGVFDYIMKSDMAVGDIVKRIAEKVK